MNGQTVLVTGASGFIGSALVERLVADGAHTLALVRTSAPSAEVATRLAGATLLTVRDGTAEELRDLLAPHRPEVVFHLASTGVRGSVTDQEIIHGNVNLMADLLLALADQPPKRFLYTGSCAEYGDIPGLDMITEETLPAPHSVYGAAKLSTYHCGRELASKLAIPFTNLRLFGVYGPGEGPQRLLPYLIGRLANHQLVELSDGEQVRDFVHVDDVVRALLIAATSPELPSYDVYNISTGIPHKVREVVQLVAQIMHQSESLLGWGQREYRATDAMRIVGCSRRFARTTGWRPQVTLEAGLAGMVRSYAVAASSLRAA